MGSSAQRKTTTTSSRDGGMKRQKGASAWESAGEPKSKRRFVGVRQRPSGRWVAEIKDTTQKIRLWLGTFDSAEEGAKAYDSAARALRGANTRTNFVTAISCDGAATSKAARLIRLRQIANAQLEEERRFGHGSNPGISPLLTASSDSETRDDERHGLVPVLLSPSPASSDRQVGHRQNASSATQDHGSEIQSSPSTLQPAPNAVNYSLLDAASPQATHRPSSPPSRPPSEAHPKYQPLDESHRLASLGSENCSVAASTVDQRPSRSCSSSRDAAESPLRSCESTSTSPEQLAAADAIPWSDYVLVDGLDLTPCDATCGAYDFSAEAMDRDSCTSTVLLDDRQYLSDVDSTAFLLCSPEPATRAPSCAGTASLDDSCSSP